MTSDVRKCPKSAKSDRFSGFLHLAIERQGCIRCDVKTKDAHARCGSTVEIFFTQLGDLPFIFEKNRFFSHFLIFSLDFWNGYYPVFVWRPYLGHLSGQEVENCTLVIGLTIRSARYTRFCFRSWWFRVIPGYEKREISKWSDRAEIFKSREYRPEHWEKWKTKKKKFFFVTS